MRYFDEIDDIVELKMKYKHLIYENHPDRHPGQEEEYTRKAQQINDQYRDRFDTLHGRKQQQQTNAGRTEQDDPSTGFYWSETSADFIAIFAALLQIDGITLEICGSWLWIHGNTYPAREILKQHNARWAPKKKLWYWRPPEAASRNHKPWDMDRIRTTYGSEQVKSDKRATVRA